MPPERTDFAAPDSFASTSPLRKAPVARTSAATAWLLSEETLAALAPTAAGVPRGLWQRVLGEPVGEILDRPGKGFRAKLCEIAYRLGGGSGPAPAALGAMLEIIHAGSMIIDDIEDEALTRRGAPAVHRLCGLPIALNAGNWMYFAPFELIGELGLTPERELQLRRRMTRVLLDCHFGQALDLGARVRELTPAQLPDVVATMTTLKTGRLLALAALAGAMTGGADESRAATIAEFGEALGVGLQMLDDLGNLSPRTPVDKRYEDLKQERATWPWAWAAATMEPEAFQTLVQHETALAARGRTERASDAHESELTAGWRSLATRLLREVSSHGRAVAHWHLRAALSRLSERLGPDPMIDVLEREIVRLEASYG